MAFCNSCGATLSPGMKFCNKCGAPQAASVAAPGATPAQPATLNAPAPPPSTGGSSALKIILIAVAVIVVIGILAVGAVSLFVYRVAKSSHVSQQGDNVKAETPFGTFETSKDPEQIAKDRGCLGVWLDTFAFQARAFY